MYVRAGRPAFARPCVGVHKSTSLMSSSLLAPHNLEADLNREDEIFANKLKVEDRIENIKNYFITVKDHKGDFQNNPACTLINLSKTQKGKISKDTCTMLRTALNESQWRYTNDCIKWFTDYDKNDKCSFIKYDIKEFYPTITEKAVDEKLKLAKEYILILEDKINIIKHCCKSILYHNEELWIKKGDSDNFGNPIGSFDGAKLSEFIWCLLLYNVNSIIDPCNRGL